MRRVRQVSETWVVVKSHSNIRTLWWSCNVNPSVLEVFVTKIGSVRGIGARAMRARSVASNERPQVVTTGPLVTNEGVARAFIWIQFPAIFTSTSQGLLAYEPPYHGQSDFQLVADLKREAEPDWLNVFLSCTLLVCIHIVAGQSSHSWSARSG